MMLSTRQKKSLPYLASGNGARTVFLPNGSQWVTSFSDNTPLEALGLPLVSGSAGIYTFHVVRYLGLMDNYRTELQGRNSGVTKEILYDTAYTASFTLHVPTDWLQDSLYEIIFQIHGMPDLGEPSGLPPLAALCVLGNQFYVFHYHSSAAISIPGSTIHYTESPKFGTLVAGSSYDFIIEYKITRGHLANGYFNIKIGGVYVYQYTGPVGSDDTVGPYIKFGIYKAAWNPKNDTRATTNERRYGFSNMVVAAV